MSFRTFFELFSLQISLTVDNFASQKTIMKRITKQLLIGAIAILAPLFEISAGEVVFLPDNGEPVDPPVVDPDRGQRMPPKPIFCDIDIEAHTITSDSEKVNGADTFEIWDADGQACLQVFGSKEEFLDALAASSGAVVIKLRGDGYSLKGYIII